MEVVRILLLTTLALTPILCPWACLQLPVECEKDLELLDAMKLQMSQTREPQ